MNRSLTLLYSILLFVLSVNVTMSQLVDVDTLQVTNSKKEITGYQDTCFVGVPKELSDKSLRIQNGKLQVSEDNISWKNVDDTAFLKTKLSGDWEKFNLLGSVGFRQHPVKLEETLDKSYKSDVLALDKQAVYEIGEKHVDMSTNQICVYSRKVDEQLNTLLSSFVFNTDSFITAPYQGVVLPNNILVILAGTDHPNVNFMIFYDLKKEKPVGFKSFSTIVFDGVDDTVVLGNPYPKSLEGKEQITTSQYSLFIHGELNPDFQDTSYFPPSK